MPQKSGRDSEKKRVRKHVEPEVEGEDIVDEASEESFPASDPPSFTPVRSTGKPRRPKRPMPQ